jgi:hypothetical protein
MPGQEEKSELLLQQVYERLQELERRVTALERHPELRASPPNPSFLGTKPRKEERQGGGTSAVPVLGQAVLAIAGAYLLRALAEAGTLPRRLLLALAIGYAGALLVWAVRKHQKCRFASSVFGMTAAFILAPLMWEGTVRFQDLPPKVVPVILLGYVALSLWLAWRERLEVIPWIAVVMAVGTTLVLLIATHELGTLTVGLLAMALVTEIAAWSGRWLGLRALSAMGTDFAVGVLGVVMTSPDGVPAGYRPMSASEINSLCIALLLIYGGSVAVRGFGMVRKWTFGEVAQAVVAFGLGTWVSLLATQGGASTAFGVIFLALAMPCYWGALKRFADPEMRWNRRVCGSYAAALMLAGIFLVFAGNLRAVSLSFAAVAAVMLFARTGYLTVGIHGTLYLVVASIMGGLFGYARRALVETVPAWPEGSFWAVLLAGLVSYSVGARARGEGWKTRLLWVAPAAVAGVALAALMVAGIVALPVETSASRLSVVRTAVTCVMALGLGYAGSRWNRVELGWLAYAAIGLGALKLVLEDLRFGNAGTLMVSLLFYGLILILLPKVTRFGRVEI